LDLDNLIVASNINGVTNLIINKIDVLDKVNYYCLIHHGKEMVFSSKIEFVKYIEENLYEHCLITDEIIFSQTPYDI